MQLNQKYFTLDKFEPFRFRFISVNLMNLNLDIYWYLDGYTIDDVNYVWKKDNPVTLKVGMNKTLHGFEVTNVTTGKCQAQTLMGIIVEDFSNW